MGKVDFSGATDVQLGADVTIDTLTSLSYLADIDFVGGVHKVLAPLEKSMPELKEEILEMCEDVISK